MKRAALQCPSFRKMESHTMTDSYSSADKDLYCTLAMQQTAIEELQRELREARHELKAVRLAFYRMSQAASFEMFGYWYDCRLEAWKYIVDAGVDDSVGAWHEEWRIVNRVPQLEPLDGKQGAEK